MLDAAEIERWEKKRGAPWRGEPWRHQVRLGRAHGGGGGRATTRMGAGSSGRARLRGVHPHGGPRALRLRLPFLLQVCLFNSL